MAFLGMELNAHDVAALDRTGEIVAVAGDGADVTRIGTFGVVRVHEVIALRLLRVAEEPSRRSRPRDVPSHMRDAQPRLAQRELAHTPVEEREARQSAFLA